MRNRYIYALIPLGFVALVAFMLLGGEAVQETTDGPVGDVIEGQGE
ncbi:hypothetical protein [Loktanella sp. SALINAS62]|nr:hypothetical protein [Loktanella sp. SALINAS62]MBS1302354.1 hypothetical protein [Loktanella sp. SALINAS62]